MFEFWEMLTNLQQEDDPEVREVITVTLQLLGNARGSRKIIYHFFSFQKDNTAEFLKFNAVH